MTVLILMISMLAAIYGHGNLRVSAGGFAIAGGLYFLLAFSPWLNSREHLLTDLVLETLQNVIHDETESPVNTLSFTTDGRRLVTGSGSSSIWGWDVSNRHDSFHNIGHALWALIFGAVGSFVAGWFSRRATPSRQLNGQNG